MQNEMRKAEEQRRKEAQRVAKEREQAAVAMRKQAERMRDQQRQQQRRQQRQQQRQLSQRRPAFGVPLGGSGGRIYGMPSRRASPGMMRGSGVRVFAGGQRRRF